MNHHPRYQNVCSFPALLAAFRKARQAKRGKNGEPAFYLDLESNLLELKAPATVVAPVGEGIPWLGFRVYPGTVRLDHGSRMRFLRKACGNFRVALNASLGDMAGVVSSAQSIFGHIAHCDSLMFRRSVLARHGLD